MFKSLFRVFGIGTDPSELDKFEPIYGLPKPQPKAQHFCEHGVWFLLQALVVEQLPLDPTWQKDMLLVC